MPSLGETPLRDRQPVIDWLVPTLRNKRREERQRAERLRRRVVAATAASLAVAVAGLVGWDFGIRPHQCAGLTSYDRDLFHIDGECVGTIGLQDDATFGPDTTEIIDLIRNENRLIVDGAKNPDTGWVRIGVAMPMTGSEPTGDDIRSRSPDSYKANAVLPTGPIVHALRGAYLAQRVANSGSALGSGPSVKLELMNIGSQEASWRKLKPRIEQLAADREHPLVAVVGLGVSMNETESLANWLHGVSVPAIGAVLSAVDEPEGLFNISPSNQEYVQGISRYLGEHKPGTGAYRYVEAIDTNGEHGDLYVDDLHRRFAAFQSKARAIRFHGSLGDRPGYKVNFTTLTSDVCGVQPDGTTPVVLFGGRPRDLKSLLGDLADANCNTKPLVAVAATGLAVDDETRDNVGRAGITLVVASGVDTDAWIDLLVKNKDLDKTCRGRGSDLPDRGSDLPAGFSCFALDYMHHVLDIDDKVKTIDVDTKISLMNALRDGYAVNQYDAVASAVWVLRQLGSKDEQPPTGSDLDQGLSSMSEDHRVPGAAGELYFPKPARSGSVYSCGRAIVVSHINASGEPELVRSDVTCHPSSPTH